MSEPANTVTRSLAEVALELRARPLTGEAAADAERAIIDWLGAALGGSRTVPARALAGGMGPLSGAARLVGGPGRAPAPLAALINGTAAHALEVDDIYAPGLYHPGAPTIAAALAVADQVGAPGPDFLRAVVTGYEIGCRVAADLGPAHYARWHTTGTAGTLGAAAAAAELLGLDADRLATALALAATMSAGLQQTFRGDAMGKPLHAGNAASAGVVAAIAAAGGVTGAADALEGEAGLAAATGCAPDWVASRAPLIPRLAISEITVKPYPCCGHAFAVIDAMLRLRERGLRAGDVRQLVVETYAAAVTVAGLPRPRTPAERRFSIPFLAALALADGGLSDAAVTAAAPRPELAALMSRIAMAVDPVFERAFPARRGARVRVSTRDGQEISAAVPDRSGSPENPLADAAIERKFLIAAADLAGHGAPELLRQVRSLRTGGQVSDIALGGDGWRSGD